MEQIPEEALREFLDWHAKFRQTGLLGCVSGYTAMKIAFEAGYQARKAAENARPAGRELLEPPVTRKNQDYRAPVTERPPARPSYTSPTTFAGRTDANFELPPGDPGGSAAPWDAFSGSRDLTETRFDYIESVWAENDR